VQNGGELFGASLPLPLPHASGAPQQALISATYTSLMHHLPSGALMKKVHY
jgi:hypothetical protein